jgi:hypothetical protein
MARISREAIARLTTEVSLVRLVEARGIALTERGGVLVGTGLPRYARRCRPSAGPRCGSRTMSW